MQAPTVVCLDGALRLADNAALRAALASPGTDTDAGSIVLVHTADPSLYSPARLVALAAAVDDLRQRTQGRVVSLLGEPSKVLPPLVKDLEAVRVVVQRALNRLLPSAKRLSRRLCSPSVLSWSSTAAPTR